MLANTAWVLPDGVDELLPQNAVRLEHLRQLLLSEFAVWGYQLVFPPLIEYLDALKVGAGQPLALQTFQFTDQLSGKQLGVRPDITPQLARIDAKSFQSAAQSFATSDSNAGQISGEVRRLCYCGSVLRAKPRELHARRTQVQVGVELFGHSGLESDLEVLSLMLSSLEVLGLSGMVVDFGHVGVMDALLTHLFGDSCRTRGLEEEQSDQERRDRFLAIVERRSLPDMQVFVDEHISSPSDQKMCLVLLKLFGAPEKVLSLLEQFFTPLLSALQPIIKELRSVALRLSQKIGSQNLHLDLAELRGFHYYTGLAFAVYHPASRQVLIKGGRYDNVGKAFGSERSAIGFSLDLLQLLTVSTEAPVPQKAIFAPFSHEPELIALIAQLRGVGETVISALEVEQVVPTLGSVFDRQLLKKQGAWVIELL